MKASITFLFYITENNKKISLKVILFKQIGFFDNVVDPAKAKPLNSICLARCVYHVPSVIGGRNI